MHLLNTSFWLAVSPLICEEFGSHWNSLLPFFGLYQGKIVELFFNSINTSLQVLHPSSILELEVQYFVVTSGKGSCVSSSPENKRKPRKMDET